MNGKINKIQLVFPPLSNQAAEWLKDVDQIQEILSHSNLYAIGQREELFFEFNYETCVDYKLKLVHGRLRSGTASDSFIIDMEVLADFYHNFFDSVYDIDMSAGPKIFKIFSKKENDFINWWTVEKLVYERSMNCPFIKGLNSYRNFSKYNIHYIGISLENDSLTRLVTIPHDKRIRILSNEWPLNTGSRLTDEIVLFFFDIQSCDINTYDQNNPNLFITSPSSIKVDKKNIIADAEKALVKILNSQYNEIKYQNYPKSKDGLWNFPVDTLIYFFGDSYEFVTNNVSIVGNYTVYDVDKDNKADFIIADKKNVQLIKINKSI